METELTKPQQTLVLCSAFIAGTGYYLLDFNIYLLLTFLSLLLFLVFKKLISAQFLILCIVIYLISITYTDFRTPKPGILYEKAPAKLELTGQIISEPRPDLENRTKFYFKTDEGKTLVTIYDYKRKFNILKTGDIIKIHGSVKHPYKATNWGQFDYGKYLRNRGVFTLTHVGYKNWALIDSRPSGLAYFTRKLSEIKNKIISIHAKNLKSPKLEVLGGMVFGDYAVPAPEEVEDNFIKSGLLHLLAASGLNVGIIFGIWYFIASKLKIAFRPRIITGMLLVGLYSLMTGLPPSVTRAALMMELLLLGKLFDRKADNVGILVVVCALMLLFNPLMLANVGFQLSFVVTFGLLLFARYFNFWSGIVLIPLVAQLFAAPVQIFHFNNFAIYSVPANMAVMPFVSIISAAGFTGSIFSLIPVIGEFICFIADKIAEPFIFMLLFVSDLAAGLPGSLQYLPTPGIPAIIAAYAVLAMLVYARKQAIIAALILLILVFKGDFSKDLRLIFFDVGEGDAMLLSTPDQRHILVDTGPPGWYNPANTAIIPYLRDKGINRLDALVLTHPDSDHIGGTLDILNAVKVDTIYHNGVKNNTKIYRSIEAFIDQNRTKTVVISDQNRTISDKNVIIKALKPDNTDKNNNNEDSIMLYIVYKNFSALLMADCEADSLDIIGDTVKKPVTLLKVGHHGSKGAVSKELLEYINPTISIISVGEKGYQWGHPHSGTISMLYGFKSKVFRTDKDYAVRVVTDGDRTEYETFKSRT